MSGMKFDSDTSVDDKITLAYTHFIDILNRGDNIRDVSYIV